jgi:hypothetical protein
MALSVNERVANLRARRRLAAEPTAHDRAAFAAARFAADRSEGNFAREVLLARRQATPIITRAGAVPANTTTSGIFYYTPVLCEFATKIM